MKRITSLLLVIAFAGMILLPSSLERNSLLSNQPVIADGYPKPVPPLPPCALPESDPSLSV
jgi:hypothetical protein